MVRTLTKGAAALAVVVGALMQWAPAARAADGNPTCLVLADGYVSEYAWGQYAELAYPSTHPGHYYCVRGVLGHKDRFGRWLSDWDVKRVDLEQHEGPLYLDGVDLVILDAVRQSVCDPHEPALVEYVRRGGGLLVYAGFWGLGGCPKSEYSVRETVDSYQHSPLGAVLPVEILETPDHILYAGGTQHKPVFVDQTLGEGIDVLAWNVYGLHACKARGETLAELDGHPLISLNTLDKGRIVVYTGDDIAGPRLIVPDTINPFSRTLWRRLAALATGDPSPIPAVPDPPTTWDKPPAFAHPDQPMNFHWGGYFYYRTPALTRLWAKDLVTHSSTLYANAPRELGEAGIQAWNSLGQMPRTQQAREDPETWVIDATGNPVSGSPCVNNPKTLEYLREHAAATAAKWAETPWVVYGHMGDEVQYGDCWCAHCRNAFESEFSYPMPELHDDFSPEYLDQWIDYCLFKNASAGRMYAVVAGAAKEANPRLKMFASTPQSGGMAHGDDQFHTQSGYDLLWDHTYPGTMAIRVGLNVSLLEETGVLQGRPYVPVFDLLQAFDSYDRAPRVPPPEYVREMVWQAIAHGCDSVGYFVYNAFWWTLPGTEAWEEIGRMGHDVLEPLTPTLYQMRNAPQPVGLLYCYSQEAVDGLKERTWDDSEPWKPVVRWWTHHATQEAYEVLKYAHVPFNVVSEHRLLEGNELPWKAIVIPYVEHLHTRSREALAQYMAAGGKVYVGANSTLDLPGSDRLPVAFDTKFTTWWPENRKTEWNQRRARQYLIGAFLEKAISVRTALSPFCDIASPSGVAISVDDPEIVYNVREAGTARYLFFINDHQLNPTSPELRRKRQQYNHFMLLPQTFPCARTKARVKGVGYLYTLLADPGAPRELDEQHAAELDLTLEGGAGAVFVLLPEAIRGVEITAPCVRRESGVAVEARAVSKGGPVDASLPVRIDFECGPVRQTVFATTQHGVLSWNVPFLKTFPEEPITVVITDLASGVQAIASTV